MIKIVSFTKEELRKMLNDEVVYSTDFDDNPIQYMSRERMEDMLIHSGDEVGR